MEWIIDHWIEIVTVAGSLVGAARIAVRWTPTKTDDIIIGRLDKILHVLALKKRQ